ncbi:MAG TPA: filamentous hemagglutinin N-terminal domain-containing protein [Devosiaceae bacterium]
MKQGTKALLLMSTALVPFAASPLLANPLGSTVVAGDATVSGEGTTAVTVDQSSDKAIIDWRSFNIGLDESTTFNQPDVQSVTLNRVTGGEGTSTIAGQLNANGQVFLVNPDGVVFGKNATVDVGGMVATTSDISNADFMAGNFTFNKPGSPGASIVNLGTINVSEGGMAALVAPGVRNAGTVTAKLGKVSLASGNTFTLDLYGDNLINLALDDGVASQVIDVSTGKPLSDLVSNSGLLKADGGTVQLTASAARTVVDSVINNTGNIEADSVGLKNGKIVLSAATADTKSADAPTQTIKVSGKLSASGLNASETGGKIQISAENIELAAATIDAFGWKGGGSVLIGGDVQGGNPNSSVVDPTKVQVEDTPIAHATTVSMDPNSTIDASATSDGNGGKVVLWSDQATSARGTIDVSGGSASGDGGYAEISSAGLLDDAGLDVLLGSANGTSGTALFDPGIAIIDGSNVATYTNVLNQGGGATAIIYGGSVDVKTDIIKTKGSDATLKIFGDDGITLDSGVTIGSSSGALNVLLDADADYNIFLYSSLRGNYQLTGSDPQYPGAASTSEHLQGILAFEQESQSVFEDWLNYGGPFPDFMSTSVQGQDAFTAWWPYMTSGERSQVNSSVLNSGAGAHILTNGGNVTYYSHQYNIAEDVIDYFYDYSGYASYLQQQNAAQGYDLGIVYEYNLGGGQSWYYNRAMKFSRVAEVLPSGLTSTARFVPISTPPTVSPNRSVSNLLNPSLPLFYLTYPVFKDAVFRAVYPFVTNLPLDLQFQFRASLEDLLKKSLSGGDVAASVFFMALNELMFNCIDRATEEIVAKNGPIRGPLLAGTFNYTAKALAYSAESYMKNALTIPGAAGPAGILPALLEGETKATVGSLIDLGVAVASQPGR